MKTNALAGSPMPGSLTAWEGRGELHAAGPYGIEASLLFAYEQPDSRPDRLSHPWTAVLSMRLAPRWGLIGSQHGEVDTMALRGLSALVLLGAIVYALLSGNWGIGAIAFGLVAMVLGLDRLRAARTRPERAIGWVLVGCGVFVVLNALTWMSSGGALNRSQSRDWPLNSYDAGPRS
jgi:hypothetical protein